MNWTPGTKLLQPEPGNDILDRSELLERLHRDVTTKRLTLISAQAGAGKTTLVASLAQQSPDLPLAWMILDEGDNRPESFWPFFLAAANRILPNCTLNSATLLADQPELASDAIRLMGLFINDVLECKPEPFVIVMDDLHILDDQDCLAALDYLLANLPPMMRLVATARDDPPLSLSRLRARGQLAEIRMAQLRFSAEETAAWFNAALGLQLSENDLAAVDRFTEGWVTALRLLALSLQEREALERDRFIHELGHSHRFIFDYLIDEVVKRLPSEKRQFLLETSILSAMTPELCRAVTGRADAHLQLETLYRQNMFISRSDAAIEDGLSGDPTYHYHALLREVLQRELRLKEHGRLPELHRRAALAMRPSGEAVHHYLSAEAWQEAADMLEILVREQVELGKMPAHLVELVERLPEEVVAERPWLVAAQGIHLLQRGHKEKGRPFLEKATRQLADSGDDLSRAYLLFNLSNVTVGPEMAVYLDQIGTIFAAQGDKVPPRWQVSYHNAMVWKHLHVHNWPEVEKHLDKAVDITIRSAEPGAYYTLATNNFTHFFYSQRAGAAILRLRDGLLANFPPGDLLARFGVINISMCRHWLRAEVNEADKLARQAQWMSRQYGVFSWADANSMLVSLNIQWLRDDLKEMAQNLNSILDYIARVEAWNVARNDIMCWLALVYWREGRGVEARRFLPDMETYTFFERQQINTGLVRALVADAEGDLFQADRHLRESIALERVVGFTTTIAARLLLAVIYWQASEREAALRELDAGLAEWQRRDLPGVILQTGQAIIPLLETAVSQNIRPDFANRCLDAFDLDAQPRPLFVPATGETLTLRETEVLGLIVQGQTNPQIAEALVISESTVKSHVTKILAKLGVARRTEAALLARELGLG
ncbi:MAG TPA: LuxR C-terminal-related transcriptional regulator [Anaerolineae bacterium]|jgi:LuxR family maltose regulon positive regulatory protein|nr:LuxR C-terminal-related transcriptional regulator [Anaerolineae bacterium]